MTILLPSVQRFKPKYMEEEFYCKVLTVMYATLTVLAFLVYYNFFL